ncbi:mRNA transport factor [Theileria orientalis strain Shintoku]|uniref:mRNA transport factor n=1 Tax=Theileria orientalis strain Shintoku TaxID=869250 RepID=J4C3S6_THEOR|nr:mRNA transport factor [Theileria orientalis strain Shintoku]BAM40956.1 mRNA transport factor [Theileria orientalis strain Shintoku]|eukprot:XP_009691257.1 mRNA transport factor [Theileria orientalis strain Shintoku]
MTNIEDPVKSIEGWVLLVTGIHEEAQEEDVRDLFENYGTVTSVHLNLDRRTGYVKGYALLEFKERNEAENAINNYHVHSKLENESLSHSSVSYDTPDPETEVYNQMNELNQSSTKFDSKKNDFDTLSHPTDHQPQQILDNSKESEASSVEDDEEDEEDEYDDILGTEIPDELKDFITDEVVEDFVEEATDVEYEPDKLDDEDLALIEENIGTRLDDDEEDEASFKRLRRLKKGTKKVKEPEPEIDHEDSWDEDDQMTRAAELSDAWGLVAECFGRVDIVIQILKNERMPLQNLLPNQPELDSDYDPKEDPDYDNDVGLIEHLEKTNLSRRESVEQDSNVEVTLEQYVDPDELAKEYLTKEDEEIRNVDEPERLYIRYKNRNRKLDEREIQNEAQWMARRLLNEFNIDLSKENVKKSYEQTFEGTYTNKHTSVSSDVAEKCEMLITWFLNEHWEVPFILYHKRHLVCPPLTDTIVWRVFQLDLEWSRLNTLSKQVQKTIEKIGHEFLPTDILYFSTNFDYIEHLNDVNIHLTYHYTSLHVEQTEPVKVKPLEDFEGILKVNEEELEHDPDDPFADFEIMDNPVHAATRPSSPEQLENVLEDEVENEIQLIDEDNDENTRTERSKIETDTLFEYEDADESGRVKEDDDRDVDMGSDEDGDDEEEEEGDEGEQEEQEEDELTYHDEGKELLEGMDSEYLLDSTPKVIEKPVTQTSPHARLVSKKNPALYLIEKFERIGMSRICSNYVPSANEFAKLLEKTIVSTGNSELKVDVSGHLNTRDLDLIQGNEEYQIDEFFGPYASGAYSSGKTVFNALVDYYAKKYSSHISVRRILREYYRNYCTLTCVTTPKGEERVEVSDSSWIVKRMCGMPLNRFLRNSQLYYEYPHNFSDRRDRFIYLNDRLRELKMVELYLLILKMEKEGQVVLTVHPLTKADEPYWKSDHYSRRFQQFYTVYKDLSNFLRQMEAEKNLIEKETLILNDLYSRDLTYLSNMQAELIKLFPKRKVSKNSIWKYFCTILLERMLNRELIPLFRKEVREMLYKLATNSVLYNCQQYLRHKLEVAPVRETVMCVLNDNDALNVYVAVVDDRSNALYMNVHKNPPNGAAQSGFINNLISGGQTGSSGWDAWSQQLYGLLSKFQVRTILIGLVDMSSLTLYYNIEEVLNKMNSRVKLRKVDTQLPRLVASKYLRAKSKESGTAANAPGSEEHNYHLIMAVAVCRFYLNTLLEMTNLWADSGENYLLMARLHALQDMVPRDRLEHALMQVMVTHVNAAGVDLEMLLNANQNKRNTSQVLNGLKAALGSTKESTEPLEHYLSMKSNVLNYVAFICGLGIRKAQLFLDKLRTFTPSSRSSLTQIFGPLVFMNMASFVKFGKNASTDSLDATRIHPTESGFIAEKLCNGSLDEKLSGEEAVHEIMSNPAKLDDLDLEAYSVLLNEKQDMPRMYPYLTFIKQELQYPYHGNCTSQKLLSKPDRRDRAQKKSDGELTNVEVFYSVLNLDKNTFKVGSNVMCKFEALHSRMAKVVLLPLSLRGYVTDFQQFRSEVQKLAKDNPKYNNLAGEIFEGRVTRIDYEPIVDGSSYNYKVEVSLTNYQKKHVLNTFLNELVNERLDEYTSPLLKYDINRSNLPVTAQKKKIQYRRNIRHPAYKMWPLQKVITYLRQPEVPVGECCICPMSEWDRLNLVIKTCSYPFNFASFVIYERNQRVPGELGKELLLQNEKYSNLDQIIAQFCETLKLNLEEFYTHPKFRHNCELAKVERDLIQESALKPDNINWAIIPPNPKRTQGVNHPLRFILVVIPPGFSVISQEAKSLQDPIYVTHKSFKLWTHEEKSLRDLISWWKEYGYWHRNMERTKYMQQKQSQSHPQPHGQFGQF